MSRNDLRIKELHETISFYKDKLEYYEEIDDKKNIKSLKDSIKKLEKELNKLLNVKEA